MSAASDALQAAVTQEGFEILRDLAQELAAMVLASRKVGPNAVRVARAVERQARLMKVTT